MSYYTNNWNYRNGPYGTTSNTAASKGPGKGKKTGTNAGKKGSDSNPNNISLSRPAPPSSRPTDGKTMRLTDMLQNRTTGINNTLSKGPGSNSVKGEPSTTAMAKSNGKSTSVTAGNQTATVKGSSNINTNSNPSLSSFSSSKFPAGPGPVTSRPVYGTTPNSELDWEPEAVPELEQGDEDQIGIPNGNTDTSKTHSPPGPTVVTQGRLQNQNQIKKEQTDSEHNHDVSEIDLNIGSYVIHNFNMKGDDKDAINTNNLNMNGPDNTNSNLNLNTNQNQNLNTLMSSSNFTKSENPFSGMNFNQKECAAQEAWELGYAAGMSDCERKLKNRDNTTSDNELKLKKQQLEEYRNSLHTGKKKKDNSVDDQRIKLLNRNEFKKYFYKKQLKDYLVLHAEPSSTRLKKEEICKNWTTEKLVNVIKGCTREEEDARDKEKQQKKIEELENMLLTLRKNGYSQAPGLDEYSDASGDSEWGSDSDSESYCSRGRGRGRSRAGSVRRMSRGFSRNRSRRGGSQARGGSRRRGGSQARGGSRRRGGSQARGGSRRRDSRRRGGSISGRNNNDNSDDRSGRRNYDNANNRNNDTNNRNSNSNDNYGNNYNNYNKYDNNTNLNQNGYNNRWNDYNYNSNWNSNNWSSNNNNHGHGDNANGRNTRYNDYNNDGGDDDDTQYSQIKQERYDSDDDRKGPQSKNKGKGKGSEGKSKGKGSEGKDKGNPKGSEGKNNTNLNKGVSDTESATKANIKGSKNAVTKGESLSKSDLSQPSSYYSTDTKAQNQSKNSQKGKSQNQIQNYNDRDYIVPNNDSNRIVDAYYVDAFTKERHQIKFDKNAKFDGKIIAINGGGDLRTFNVLLKDIATSADESESSNSIKFPHPTARPAKIHMRLTAENLKNEKWQIIYYENDKPKRVEDNPKLESISMNDEINFSLRNSKGTLYMVDIYLKK